MKRITYIYLVLVAMLSTFAAIERSENNDFAIIIEPKWQDLEQEPANAKKFGGKLILVGSITVKKRSKEHVALSKIYLRWQGKPIDTLVGSLYKKEPDK